MTPLPSWIAVDRRAARTVPDQEYQRRRHDGPRLLPHIRRHPPVGRAEVRPADCGAVSWARDALVGICLRRADRRHRHFEQSDDGLRPRLPRVEVNEAVSVREGATTYRMKVCDISQGGHQGRGRRSLPSGSHVVVTIAGIEPLPGVVRWTAEQQMGITFNRLLALPTLVEWLHAHIPVPGCNAVGVRPGRSVADRRCRNDRDPRFGKLELGSGQGAARQARTAKVGSACAAAALAHD